MEMRVHPPCDLVADTRRRLQIRESGHLHPARRAEVIEQRTLARRTDTGNFVQLALPDVPRSPRAVRADREPMRKS